MIKRTLYIESPAYISTKNAQLLIKIPEVEKNLPLDFRESHTNSIPIEDIGILILDNPQITITQGAIQQLTNNNCSVITCDASRMPSGILIPISHNTLQAERYRVQISASVPLKKQLWQQTIQTKILNQAAVITSCLNSEFPNMKIWAKEVKSGDSDNMEARAAVFYWSNLFSKHLNFIREREGAPPNSLLNYGYSILRAIIARSLVATGLHPSFGIHHKNRYNSFALADDIMEPYRPYVDSIVFEIVNSGIDYR